MEAYRALRAALDARAVVPLVGAGASAGARIAGEQSILPSGRGLALSLSQKCGFGENELDTGNLLEVASAMAALAGRYVVEDELKRIFLAAAEPKEFHTWLAETAPRLVVTTNYDNIIEHAFASAGRPLHVALTPTAVRSERGDHRYVRCWSPLATESVDVPFRKFDVDALGGTVLYKLHGGTVPGGRWEWSAATEDDYFEIGGRIYEGTLLPPQVEHTLRASSFLLVGYSLRDVHVRQLLASFRRYTEKRRHFAVVYNITRLDRARFHNRFELLEIAADELPARMANASDP